MKVFWFVQQDKGGKSRGWVSAPNANAARKAFAAYRATGKFPTGWTVEKRGIAA